MENLPAKAHCPLVSLPVNGMKAKLSLTGNLCFLIRQAHNTSVCKQKRFMLVHLVG